MSQPDDIDKIADLDLREFLTSRSTDKRSVLIEISTEPPMVDFEAQDSDRRRVRARSITPQQTEQPDEAIARTRSLIASVTGQEPEWLWSASTFLAELDAEQLQKILESSDVQVVRFNRRWQA